MCPVARLFTDFGLIQFFIDINCSINGLIGAIQMKTSYSVQKNLLINA